MPILTARRNKVSDLFSFEMIEGMANHVRRAIQETGQEMVLYAPVATRDQFINAIGYLIRRLDENTGEQNFLRQLNRLETNSDAWQFLTDHFKASVRQKDRPAKTPHRIQNRLTEKFPEKMGTYFRDEFENEPNTDWSLAANREWAAKIEKNGKKALKTIPSQSRW